MSTSNNNWANQEPLTLDKLRRIQVKLRQEFGPTPVFLSSKLFPSDKAMMVESATEKFTCAAPDFWAKLAPMLKQQDMLDRYRAAPGNPMFTGIQIQEIDFREDDTPERRKYLQGIWDRLRDAFEVALTPLPDWLRKPAAK